MLDMVKASIILFFQGKLFQNPNDVICQLAIGIGLTVLIFLVFAKFTGLPTAGAIAGFIGGAVQPALFKNLKFR
jgi:hypothetical protein